MASGSNVFTNVTNSLASGSNSIVNAANSAMNSVSSIFPLSNRNSNANSNVSSNGRSNVASNVGSNRNGSHWNYALMMFVGFILLFVVLFTAFKKEIQEGYEYTVNLFRGYFGQHVKTDVMAEIVPTSGTTTELTTPPTGISTDTESATESLVERILPIPSDGKEVFNVSQNKYTYYDAEPLCKALGAELATYDQVKDAWNRGADWCNYGWVKGQMAVYPTQKGTYDALQNGPADQQDTCGTVGLNGGRFDNPELEYGVNCYGKKPQQTVPVSQTLPQTPEVLEFNKKVEQYKHDAPATPIAPFNASKWSGP